MIIDRGESIKSYLFKSNRQAQGFISLVFGIRKLLPVRRGVVFELIESFEAIMGHRIGAEIKDGKDLGIEFEPNMDQFRGVRKEALRRDFPQKFIKEFPSGFIRNKEENRL